MSDEEFKRKAALVTGGANGIGRAIVRRLAARGACVVIVDVDVEAMAAVVDRVGSEGGVVVGVTGDLANPPDIDQAYAEAVDRVGPLDILVNNAGVMDSMRPAVATSLEQWEWVMAINATAPFLLCRSALPSMLERGAGVIVNIASAAGLAGGRAGAAYTASKHAVIGLTRNIAWTYGEQGIRCNAVCPGGVRTGILQRMAPADEFGAERYGLTGSTRPRLGDPKEIADVAVFLAGDSASYVNGAALAVDGGWLAV